MPAGNSSPAAPPRRRDCFLVDEHQLAGGIANAGNVTRVGTHVLRPSNPHTPGIHALLRAVRDAGFAGASLPVGVDADGRERLVFVEGDVPVPPYPEWAQADGALASLAELLAGFHRAARSFDPAGYPWSDEMADPRGPGPVVGHNDICLENVVFRDGVAVALIDFDFAAPGRPVYDLAQMARMCVPVDDDVSAARLGWLAADRPRRLRLVADAYGLDRAGRAELLATLPDTIARSSEFNRRRVAAGDPNFVAMWNAVGGKLRFDRRHTWWTENRHQFAAALR